ncbi:hypothetical protein [Chlamydia buteonis]|uniref:Double zinc ribbon domain-containing protein n=1 Tax=Chlamydia buteonis TaxID=2494525 RepID=A0ABX8LA70_9CHLA|nr:hypothetical protein [Chlamydia buteonis]QXE27217.1 hypothetical protein HBN95_03675 [Chlamydia buteonis]QXE27865.1 hypothetical protein JJJ19_04525 [Chlamydia buteonis]
MIQRFFNFFLRLIFPKLCYGCRQPGEFLCQGCLETLKVEKVAGRCPHCYSILGVDETLTCRHCLPSFSRKTFCLYVPSTKVLALYSQACLGKAPAINFFTNVIKRQWELHQILPKAIFYLISKIPKDFAKQLSKETRIPYRGILPLERELRRLKKHVNVGAICILSDYPLPREWQDTIERYAPQPAILISLFLSETLC